MGAGAVVTQRAALRSNESDMERAVVINATRSVVTNGFGVVADFPQFNINRRSFKCAQEYAFQH